MRGGGQFLPVHQEVAVTRDAHHRAVLEAKRGGDRGGQAVTHRAAGRRQLGRLCTIMPVTVPPAREIARAVADDGVHGKDVAHRLDARAKVQFHALARLGIAPFEPFAMRVLAGREAHQFGVVPVGRHFAKFAHVGADREVGVVDAAEFVGVGVDVDQQLAGMVGGDELVAVGGRLAQSRTNHDQQVSIADPLLKLGVGAVAKLAGIDRAIVGDRILPAKGSSGRDSVADREIGPVMTGARAPVGTADDRHRVGRILEQVEQRADRAGIGGLGYRRDARAVERLDLVAQHVFGDGEHDRARAAGGGDAIGPRDIFRESAAHRRSAPPIWRSGRRRRESRSPGNLRDPCRRGRGHRRTGSSGLNPERRHGPRPTALVAPGPRVTKATPGRPVILPSASAM